MQKIRVLLLLTVQYIYTHQPVFHIAYVIYCAYYELQISFIKYIHEYNSLWLSYFNIRGVELRSGESLAVGYIENQLANI